jgi:SlyX protein
MLNEDSGEEIEERFQVLENKVIYQDRTIDELNTVVTRQQDQIDALLAHVDEIRRFLANPPEEGIDAAEEPPPPHY